MSMQRIWHAGRTCLLWRWALPTALALGLVLAAVGVVCHLRGEAIRSQSRELGLLSLALSDEIHRELRGMNAGLRAMQVELAEGGLATSGPSAVRALQTRAELMAIADTLALTDRQGRLLAASSPSAMAELASFYPGLNQLEHDAVAVSRPFADPRTQAPLVTLAVPFADATGQPGGWILATLRSHALLGAFTVAHSPAPTHAWPCSGATAYCWPANSTLNPGWTKPALPAAWPTKKAPNCAACPTAANA